MRAMEVERVLDVALNDAALTGLPYLRIIHGKGTGRATAGRARLPTQ